MASILLKNSIKNFKFVYLYFLTDFKKKKKNGVFFYLILSDATLFLHNIITSYLFIFHKISNISHSIFKIFEPNYH